MKINVICFFLLLCIFVSCTPSEKKEKNVDISNISDKKELNTDILKESNEKNVNTVHSIVSDTNEVIINISFFDDILINRIDLYSKRYVWKKPEINSGIRVYGDKLLKGNGDYRFSECNIEYKEYLVLLLLEKIDGKEIIVDYVSLKKITDTSYFTSGPVEIDGEYYDWDIVVFVNQSWRAQFTENISYAFKSNLETKKIEPVEYKSIRLYSEV
jgi:hypothetical protein